MRSLRWGRGVHRRLFQDFGRDLGGLLLWYFAGADLLCGNALCGQWAPIALTVAVPEVLGLPGGLNKKRHCKPIEINQPYVHYGTHDYNEPHVCTLSHL